MSNVALGQPVNRRLGDLLVTEGLLAPEDLRRALSEQKISSEKLGSILVRLNLLTEEQLIGFLSRQYGIPSISLSQLDIDPEVLRLVPSQLAKRYEVIPIKRTGNALTLAMSDPTNVFALDDVAFLTNLHRQHLEIGQERDVFALDDVAFLTNLQVLPVVASQG